MSLATAATTDHAGHWRRRLHAFCERTSAAVCIGAADPDQGGPGNRRASYFPYVARRGAVEYIAVSTLVVLTLVIGSVAVLTFERGGSSGVETLADAAWYSIYLLLAGEPPQMPGSVGGQVVTVFIMFMALTIFAMFTGTVSAFMVDRLQREGRVVDWDQFEDHAIRCGWNVKGRIIIKQLLASHATDDMQIVVVSGVGEDAAAERSFFDLFIDLKRNHNAVLLAVYTDVDAPVVKPADHVCRSGENIVVIAAAPVKLS